MINNKNNFNNVNSSNNFEINRQELEINKNVDSRINIMHWNCNSLNNKIDEFKKFCSKYKPHIISLNETKMGVFNANYLLQIDNYITIHKARSNDKNGGGGVALLIQKDIKYSVNGLFDSLNLEICAITLQINNMEVNLVSYYNPPNLQIYKTLFEILNRSKNQFIVMGDLNAKSTQWNASANNQNGEILNEILLENDCIVVNNNEFTHFGFNGNSKSILDYCIISSKLHKAFDSFCVLTNEDMTSDHVPISATFSNKKDKSNNYGNNKNITNKKYNLQKADWIKFKSKLPTETSLEVCNDVDRLNKFVKESIINAADNSIPVFRNNSYHNKTLPNYILELVKLRKKVRKQMNINGIDPNDRANLKTRFNKLKSLIREEIKAVNDSEWSRFIKKIGNNHTSSKPFWQRINKIRGKKNGKQIPTLVIDEHKYITDDEKADIFAKILEQTFSPAQDKIFDENFKTKVESKVNNHDFSKHKYQTKDLFEIKDLNDAIKSLKSRSSSGEDMVHNTMLKNTSLEFRKIILKLINQSISQSKIPQEWKQSTITMLPKKQSNSSNPKDYRPISLTSCIGKLAERLILIKIKCFMDSNNIIIKQQSGFRKKRQTRDNILFLTQKALESTNRGKKMCTIFFDIASAFDKVWHKGLLFKLINLKFPNHLISWIKDFLNDRVFCVRVGNSISVTKNIGAGVPQGAVLSPTLFSIFINDIPIKYSKNKFYSLLFADDLCSFKIFKKYGNVNIQIQSYLDQIEKWLKMWRLTMAPQKCNFIVFNSDRTSETKLDLKLFNSSIKLNEEIKFLGIRFDKHLCFKNQVNYIKDSCLKRMNVLKVLSNKNWGLNTKTLIEVYNSLIRSLMDYSSIIYPALSITNLEFLEKLQLRCLKIIHKRSKYESSDAIRNLPGYLTIAERFDDLNLRYIKNTLINNNEIILDLYKDYREFSDSRNLRKKTLFCKYKNELNY